MTVDLLSCFTPFLVDSKAKDWVDPSSEDDESRQIPLEVNYDSNEITYLYQAIEDKAFMAAIDFLESGKPDVVEQVKTWVTRYEKEDSRKIRWSQLPLHAALVFKAPFRLVQLLVEKYPRAVRCSDDQSMLPLHLAFRHAASDNVLHLLLKEYPAAMNAKDHKGREPLDFCKMGDAWKKGEIINMYLNGKEFDLSYTKKTREVMELEDKLDNEQKKVASLKKEREELKESSQETQQELAEVQRQLDQEREEVAKQQESLDKLREKFLQKESSSKKKAVAAVMRPQQEPPAPAANAKSSPATPKKRMGLFGKVFKKRAKE